MTPRLLQLSTRQLTANPQGGRDEFRRSLSPVDRLNELLEAERAGVEALSRLCPEARTAQMLELFQQVRDDEAWSCAGLARSIKTLGGMMSERKGDFAEKVMGEPIRAAGPSVSSDSSRAFLRW